uniref:Uncharacterized protein n=1 Tax=Arundo donax TaxID=35708 RepID=A0A0A8Z8I6_ARUDO
MHSVALRFLVQHHIIQSSDMLICYK